MIFFPFVIYMLSDHYITKKCVFCWYTTAKKRKFDFFQSLNHVDVNLKPPFLIKSGYHIVPSLFTTLKETEVKDILQHAIKYATFWLSLFVLQYCNFFLPDWLIDCFVIQLFVNRGSTEQQGLRQKKRIPKQYIWLYSPLDEIKHNKSI